MRPSQRNTEEELDIEMFDIVGYLEERGVDYSTAGTKNVSAGWIGLSCQFCGDHSNHLGINLETNRGSCFKCGKKVTALTVIQMVDECCYSRAKETFNKYILKDFSHLIKKERIRAEKTIFPSGTTFDPLPIHHKFLSSRRYDLEFLRRKYDLMFVGPTCDDWKFRIIIPVYQNAEIVTYIGRDTTGKLEVPYKNAAIEKSVIQAKHTLYGLDEIKEGGTAILVEGLFDKWRMGSHVVTTFGTQVTEEQIALLGRKNIKRAIVLFDHDASAKGEALAYSITSVVQRVECVFLNEGDPDDLTEDDVWELRRELFQGEKI
jgi:hypothetical protein